MGRIAEMFEALERHTGPKGNWIIDRNSHRTSYATVEEEISFGDGMFDWFPSEQERQECIERNEMASLQWYKDTPVGFYKIAALNMERLADLFLDGLLPDVTS